MEEHFLQKFLIGINIEKNMIFGLCHELCAALIRATGLCMKDGEFKDNSVNC